MGFLEVPSEMKTPINPGVLFLMMKLKAAICSSSAEQSLYSVQVWSAVMYPTKCPFLVLSMSAWSKKQQSELISSSFFRAQTSNFPVESCRQNFWGKNNTLSINSIFLFQRAHGVSLCTTDRFPEEVLVRGTVFVEPLVMQGRVGLGYGSGLSSVSSSGSQKAKIKSSSLVGYLALEETFTMSGIICFVQGSWTNEGSFSKQYSGAGSYSIIGYYIYQSSLSTYHLRLILNMMEQRNLGIAPLKLLYWDLVLGAATLYVFTEIGFISFLKQTDSGLNVTLYLMDSIVLLLYVIDLAVSFRRGYYWKGELILDLTKITKRYLGWRLFLDLVTIAGVAVTLVPELRGNTFRIVVFWKIYSLNQLDNLIFRVVSKYRSLYKLTNFIKLAIVYFLFCHYVACIFYWIDITLIESDYYGDNKYSYLWVYNEYLFSPVISLDWSLQYLYAMYYSVQTFTTIAYGDCTPKNPIETIFVLILLVMSTVMFAYLIEQIVVILMAYTNSVRFTYLNQVFAIYRYLQLKKVPLQLRYRVKTIYEYLWYQQRFLKSSELSQVIQKLPAKLQCRLLGEVFKIYCMKVEYFNTIPDSLFTFIIKIITQRIVLERSILFYPLEEDNCSLFFMEQSSAQYFYKYSKESSKEVTLKNISFSAFGEVEFFTGMARVLGARVVSQNVLYELSRPDFIADLKANSPESYQGFRMRGDQLLMNPKQHIFRHCQSCLQEDHWIIKCPKIHYVVDKDQLINFNNSFDNKRSKYKGRSNWRSTKVTFGVSKETRLLETRRNQRNHLLTFVKSFEKYLDQCRALEEQDSFQETVCQWPEYFPQGNLSRMGA